MKKNLVFRFRLERYFRIVSYRITFSRVRCPPDKNQNKYENAIIKGETYRKRAREGKKGKKRDEKRERWKAFGKFFHDFDRFFFNRFSIIVES